MYHYLTLQNWLTCLYSFNNDIQVSYLWFYKNTCLGNLCILWWLFYIGLYGQLGLGTNSKQTLPVLVETLKHEKVYLICCGSFETVSNIAKLVIVKKGSLIKSIGWQITYSVLSICWPTVSVNCWQTIGCLLGRSQATVHRLLAISQLTVSPQPAERVFQRVVLHNYLQLFLGFFCFFLVFAPHLLQEKISF